MKEILVSIKPAAKREANAHVRSVIRQFNLVKAEADRIRKLAFLRVAIATGKQRIVQLITRDSLPYFLQTTLEPLLEEKK